MKWFAHIYGIVVGLLLSVLIHGCMNSSHDIEKSKVKVEARK
jgi:membrane associated rhomboid family serine protease